MMRRSNDFLRCSLALGIAFVAVGAAPQIKLVSNRETFDVSLERATRSIVAARGRTAIEFRVACDGYSTIQRSIADLVNAQGDITRTDFSTRYWEARDGLSMRFEIVSRQDGKITDSQRGLASLVSNGTGTVTLERKDRAFSLPTGTLFPTRETFEILNAAVGGEGSLSRTMFQGGGKGAVYVSTATIGRSPTRPGAEDAKDSNGLLRGVKAWPVLISFFPPDAETPDSEIATHIYANGLLGSLSLVYPDYTLRAHLTRVERLPSSC